ncbi:MULTISPECIES: hypothetical protein [Chromobacterium]|uniref:Flagellar protein FlgN n=1 Tax=Chromobacterium aquaticum TaxID=467180 RepID=A0ABV8ZTX9_9NEIS|nr:MULTISPECIES: hypothetical protein [Chromobacterium]KMN30868.1 hypothetical protein VI26_20420 [Chromobacterium sp. LK1]MCD5361449.1 hypothetical protein [Chromobacterium aquaticum]
MEDILEMLAARQAALERIIEGLVLTMNQHGAIKLQDYLQIAQLMRLNSAVTDSIDVSDSLRRINARLQTHAQGGLDSINALLKETMLFAQAAPPQRDALQQGLGMRASLEICAQLEELLQRRARRPRKPTRA